MSRSKGAGGLADLISRQGGERIRFFLLRTHYRSTVLFNEPAIEEAGAGLETFYRLFKRFARVTGRDFYSLRSATSRAEGTAARDAFPAAARREKFLAAMDDDFNTGGAIAELFELASLANKHCDQFKLEDAGKDDAVAVAGFTQIMTTLKELAGIMGLFLKPPSASGPVDLLLGQIVQLVVDLRNEARGRRDFATADKIRDAISASGIALEDRPSGTEWSGGGSEAVGTFMQLVIELRAAARQSKDFATADTIRKRLGDCGISLEDRADGTDWSKK
jgi:cysteinyl-tRNA synthetase